MFVTICTRLPPRTHDTGAGYCLSQGIKRQQQHFEMMAMAEEMTRLIVAQTWPIISPETIDFVKVRLCKAIQPKPHASIK